jgi:hypothetical protein
MSQAKRGRPATVMRPFTSLSTIRAINTAVVYKPRKTDPPVRKRAARPNEASDSERLRAKAFLEDGASYQEVGRTIGRYPSTVANWFPGYQFTPRQAGFAAKLASKARKLDRLTLAEKV